MTLSFKILGFEVASIDLDLPEDKQSPVKTVVEKAVGGMSRWWTKRMFSQ